MNALAALALAAGELVCEFDSTMLLYAVRSPAEGTVLQSGRAGTRPVVLRQSGDEVHLVQYEGPSLRTTALTTCARMKGASCTRFEAAHAWHFDPRARALPAGASTGRCEPWRVD